MDATPPFLPKSGFSKDSGGNRPPGCWGGRSLLFRDASSATSSLVTRSMIFASSLRHFNYVEDVLVRTRENASAIGTDCNVEAIEVEVAVHVIRQLRQKAIVYGENLHRLLLHVHIPHPNRQEIPR